MNRYHSTEADREEQQSSDGRGGRGRSGGILAVTAIAVSLMTGFAQSSAPGDRSA
jgi:hypothetical protein